MQISFHGAAAHVTGSKHLITLKNRTKFLLDCGLFQGCGPDTEKLNSSFGFSPKSIRFVLLSHAHIDHSGLLPKLVKEGFSGKIFCTAATAALTEILLRDSGDIQASEAAQVNKQRDPGSEELFEPLYTAEDVEKTIARFRIIEYDQPFIPAKGIQAVYTNNGHLVGSAAIHLTIQEGEERVTLLYSGDVGKYRSALLNAPSPVGQADYIIMESTYGDKRHNIATRSIDYLLNCVEETCLRDNGKLIIPAFSVGRTQEILYMLNQLELEKRLPDLNYFVDSPLGNKATAVIKNYPELFNETLQNILRVDDDPFLFKGLKHITDVSDSILLKETDKPCVIIASSGTGDAGRVKHHIASCIGDKKNKILFAGYCGSSSLGGQLLRKAKSVEIFSGMVDVEARIDLLEGMSAHGDADDLMLFLNTQDPAKVRGIYLVHGEHYAQNAFAARLQAKGFNSVHIPAHHQKIKTGERMRIARRA
jgi:metallo-beta-lactamase family protein